MERQQYQEELEQKADVISKIRDLAHGVHDGVNQKYDKTHPYWFHLDMVADIVKKYAHEVCLSVDDVAPMLFGAYFHDAIEDARLTYNDVMTLAKGFFDEKHAIMATEIVYALTNEKGRTRAERANDKYYEGIRITPYAPFVKMADRVANYTYSTRGTDIANKAMSNVYATEMAHFIESITVMDPVDSSYKIPEGLMKILKLKVKS